MCIIIIHILYFYVAVYFGFKFVKLCVFFSMDSCNFYNEYFVFFSFYPYISLSMYIS